MAKIYTSDNCLKTIGWPFRLYRQATGQVRVPLLGILDYVTPPHTGGVLALVLQDDEAEAANPP